MPSKSLSLSTPYNVVFCRSFVVAKPFLVDFANTETIRRFCSLKAQLEIYFINALMTEYPMSVKKYFGGRAK